MRNRLVCGLVAVLIVAGLGWVTAMAQDSDLAPAKKTSLEFTLKNFNISLPHAPPQEQDTKNEGNLVSPAIVVGPIMEGVGKPRVCRWRHEVVGQTVQVEGVALGHAPSNPANMTTQRVIYEGGMVFIRGVDFKKQFAKGRTVRVRGVLRLHPESTLRFAPHPGIKIKKYYYIDVDHLEVIERVTDPRFVVPSLKK